MTNVKQALLVLATTSVVLGQRPSFAPRPIGYPEYNRPAATTSADDQLGNRFGDGENATSTTTQRLPIEALGDRDLVDRLSKLPVDKQPFWFINWQAIEAHNTKPQTYPQRPNFFAPIPPSTNTQTGNNLQENTGPVTTLNRHGDFNSNVNSNSTPQKKTNSGTRDVNVSQFMNSNNGLLGAAGPVHGITNTASANNGEIKPSYVQNDEALNRNRNSDSTLTANPIPSPERQPQQNYDPYNVNDQDYLYPILDPKTRDPNYVPGPVTSSTHRTVHTDRVVWSRLSDNEFRRRPVLNSQGFRRSDHPIYYFK